MDRTVALLLGPRFLDIYRTLHKIRIMVGSTSRLEAAVLVAACLIATAAPRARAQDARESGEIVGTVVDSTGGVFVAAPITLRPPRGEAIRTDTDAAGRYRFAGIAQGRYTLEISSAGFETANISIEVRPRQTIRVDVTLTPRIRESVEVRASGADARDLGGGLELSGADLASLPNDPAALLRRLVELAGVSDASELSLIVDGLEQRGRLPPLSRIQSIRLGSSGFDPEFAQPGRGRVEIVTKVSTEAFSGDLSTDYNDDRLNGTNPLAPNQAPTRQRSLSGSLGGPIVPNRWAFDIWVDQSAGDAEAVVNATVLDPQTLSPVPANGSFATPHTRWEIGIRTDYQLTPTDRLTMTFSEGRESSDREGLSSGLDLPERAFETQDRNRGLRFAWTAAGNRRLAHQLDVQIDRSRGVTRAQSAATAILVLDAFNGGGNQDALSADSRTDRLQVGERLRLTLGRHNPTAGIELERNWVRNTDRSNERGTFLFGSDLERDSAGRVAVDASGHPVTITPLERYRRTLLGQPGYGPSQFTIAQGDPTVSYARWWGGVFAQDAVALTPSFTAVFGVRHSFQTGADNWTAWAPRFGANWLLNAARGTRLRFGVGLFHQRMPDVLLSNVLQHDGLHRREIVVDAPTFVPGESPRLAGGAAQPSVRYTVADNLKTPRTVTASVGLEHRLPGTTNVSVRYTLDRGQHLLRSRIVNLQAVARGAELPLFEYEAAGDSMRHELQASLGGRLPRLTYSVFYTLGRRMSDTDGFGGTPSDSSNPALDYGYAGGDRRHLAVVRLGVTLPWGITASPSVTMMSGQPFDLTTGWDNNGDTRFTDRPAFARLGDPGAVATPLGVFNPNPASGDPLVPRNFGREGRMLRTDLHISKTLTDGERTNVSISASIDNLLNTASFTSTNGVVTSPFFGEARRALSPRRVVLSATVGF